MNWVQSQLEEELDATDFDILANNINMLPSFCDENFNLDNQLLNVLNTPNYPEVVKKNAMETLCSITGLEPTDIEFSLKYIKRLTVSVFFFITLLCI